MTALMAQERFWDVLIVAVLAFSAVVYALGTARLWRRAGAGHGLRAAHVIAFALGLLSVYVALLSPLDTLSEVLFSAHMGQHEILILVSAPLLVLGKPVVAASWAAPAGLRDAAAAGARLAPVRATWRACTAPVTVLVLHAVALWIWHVPGLFQGAMRHEALHAVQHLSFFVTSALFWWALVLGRYGRAGYGAAVFFVFLTALHSGVLGALITFARTVWYPIYEGRGDALGDQQIAGLLMWVPAGALLIVLGLALLSAWLGAAERSSAREDLADRRAPAQREASP